VDKRVTANTGFVNANLPVVHAKIFDWSDNEYSSYTNRLGDLAVYLHKSLFH
jgi:hypothetical protein